MVEDIVPSLLKKIKSEFEGARLDSEVLKDLLSKLHHSKASYLDANQYAIEIGEILSKALGASLTNETLPDGKMYYNIAQRVLTNVLGRNYELVSDYTEQVQKNLNSEAKIGLAAQVSELNQDRIDGLVNRLASEESFDDVKWLLDDPIVNFSQSIVDDSIRKNVEFHHKVGLSPKIVRRVVGHPCKWCKSLEGSYNYPEVPKDIYRRHGNCRCTVDHPGNGKKQNVHTKRWVEDKKKSVIEHRKKIGLPDNDKPYVSVKKEWLKHSKKGSVSDMEYWEQDGIKYHVDGKHVVLDYSEKEKDVAEWLAQKFGFKVQMAPRVNFPKSIPSPDYLVNGMKFDLKEITGSGKGTIDQNTRKAKTQAENIVYDVTKSILADEEIKKQLEDIYKRNRRGLETAVIKRGRSLVDVIKKRN
ncbi:gp35 [Streptococcus pneumoniae]|uniref:CdiA C-terminal domain-containing protein n=1 Tax=Streptococcus pneumoniae TaxID=1313 RepID=UPI0005E5F7BB|nr:hypothetical protein [Streptococcus pneumoniae]CIQ79151.1 gp35 [Streptococcus pneumoniae]CJM47122.1 gp35 [Streptococcus pneumoniae]COB22868.1 gp35 [Streptococcus pneumoniae]COC58706.1 gp35 [Streptococcus pneumoniae]COO43906.1 gp35 [Streptococcus pneumoniae]